MVIEWQDFDDSPAFTHFRFMYHVAQYNQQLLRK